MERSIKNVVDIRTGESFNVDLLFPSQKEGQKIRIIDKSSVGDNYCCEECNQLVETTSSISKNIYFRHKKGHSPCVYTDDKISDEELSDFILMSNVKQESQENYCGVRSKEGERHFNLKNQIAQKLGNVNFVTDIKIEKIIRNETEFKRADVYCKYQGKPIVFEIQISKLSARYILKRQKFYNENGMYLIWILDVNINHQDQFSIDVKYLTKHQNYFKVDEAANSFKLLCHFKKVIIKDNEVHTNWTIETHELSEFKFDNKLFQAYYYDLTFEEQKAKNKIQIRKIEIERNEEKQRQRIEKEKELKYLKWRKDWINSFKSEFRITNEKIRNTKGSILYFANEEFKKDEIESVEKDVKNLIWIINANNFKDQLWFEDRVEIELIDFNQQNKLIYLNEVDKINNSFEEYKKTKRSEKNQVERSIDLLIDEQHKLEHELIGKTDIAKSILKLLYEEKNKVERNHEFTECCKSNFFEEVKQLKISKNKMQEQININKQNIRTWSNCRGNVYDGMILRVKPSYEINVEELKRNRDSIFVKHHGDGNNKYELLKLSDCNIVDVFSSQKDYSFYDDYSIQIEEWQLENKKIENNIEHTIDRFRDIQLQIENDFIIWINNKLEAIQFKINCEKDKINSILKEIEDCQIENDQKIEDLELKRTEKRENIRKEFSNQYLFKWHNYIGAWRFSKCPIFLEIKNDLFCWLNKSPDEVKRITKLDFISFYNK